MDWKQFLKPDWIKIVLSVVLYFLISNSCGTMSFHALICNLLGIPLTITYILPETLGIIISFIIFIIIEPYIISCFIIWTYNNITKNKGKKFRVVIGIFFLILIILAFSYEEESIKVQCSPCFYYFTFRDYSQTSQYNDCNTPGCLYLRNGPKNITITSVSGGTLLGGPNFSPEDRINITGIQTVGDAKITIEYVDTSSGLKHTDSGTIDKI